MLNTEVFNKVKASKKKILVVTKYWNKDQTTDILKEIQELYSDITIGL